jgi:peptidoglycan/LPS O-acetylase OafA/YrhL
MKYRADIDGLRAVAILPVVIFHSGFAFAGGFIGVDVFFVISGFLITTIIAGEIGEGRFSILTFYERRARRILPAFVAVVAVTSAVAVLIMLPKDLESFGNSLWSAALFSSNIFFWVESSDYFGVQSELKPLLHSWSLAVEEQFYIVFPLVLLALHRLRLWRFAFAACALGFILSFLLSVYGVRYASMATYYLLPTRAWELLAGSLLALGVIPPPRSKPQAEVEAVAGLALILAAVFTYDSYTPFPGLMALPPVLGAALVIHSGMGGWLPRAAAPLRSLPLRSIGVISYSLYLWHWPIIVLGNYYAIERSPALSAALIGLSIAAAILCWHFVERPFRGKGAVFVRPALFAAAAASLAACVFAGGYAASSDGLPWRVPKEIRVMAEKETYAGPRRDCSAAFAERRSVDTLCVRGMAGATPDFLIIGDSHADALASVIFNAAVNARRAGYQITDTGYRPLIGYRKLGEEAKYAYLNALAAQLLRKSGNITHVIIPLYWRQATLKDRYVDEAGRVRSGLEGVENGLRALAAQYPGKQFLLVLSPANSPSFGGAVAARAAWYGRPFTPSVPTSSLMEARSAYQSVVSALAELANVSVLDLATKLCDAQVCRGMIGGQPAFSDDNHLAYASTLLFEADFTAFLRRTETTSGM